MLRTIKDLESYAIHAADGDSSYVRDFYIDDKAWVIRYLVLAMGDWRSSRKVLISPFAIGRPGHYGYPFYWHGAGPWGGGNYPAVVTPGYTDIRVRPPAELSAEQRAQRLNQKAQWHDDDLYLHDCKTMLGYHVQAIDGDVGHVEGMLLDDETWALRYLIVETSNWLLGHKVLAATAWIRDVSWQDATISLDVTQVSVQAAPTYDTDAPLTREGESRLYQHYGRQGYWLAEDAQEAREAVLKVPLQAP